MKITKLTLWEVPLTSHLTYHMAGGKTCDTVSSVVLRAQTDAGIEGWGEVCPIPHYLPAYAGNLDIMTSAAKATAERIAVHETEKLGVAR